MISNEDTKRTNQLCVLTLLKEAPALPFYEFEICRIADDRTEHKGHEDCRFPHVYYVSEQNKEGFERAEALGGGIYHKTERGVFDREPVVFLPWFFELF